MVERYISLTIPKLLEWNMVMSNVTIFSRAKFKASENTAYECIVHATSIVTVYIVYYTIYHP